MTDKALAGVTVLDLTNSVDGPYCTKLLADYGARVIKVEPPEGDPSRRVGPFPDDEPDPERSGLFVYLNANKEGVTLDLTAPGGREACRALARRVDVIVENFVPGAMAGYGLGYAALQALNPALVYVSISPFGQTGPYALWRGPDIVRQAVSGWMAQGGDPDLAPLRSGGDVSLYITGLCAAGAALTGLYHARACGQGQHVDVSAMEAILTCTGQDVYRVSLDGPGVAYERTGHRGLPFATLPCRDGWVGISVLFPPNWTQLCQWAGMEDLLEDERYDSLAKLRIEGRGAEIAERLTAWTMGQDMMTLVEEGQRRHIGVAPVPTMAQAPRLSQHVARGYFQDVEHPRAGRYVQPGPPFRMSETPWALRTPAPALGEANERLGDWLAAPS